MAFSAEYTVPSSISVDPNITLSQQVTQFDMAVIDAAYTIMNSGLMILTAEWIAKVLSGNMDQKVTPQKIGAIMKYEEYRADGTKNPASPIMGYAITI